MDRTIGWVAGVVALAGVSLLGRSMAAPAPQAGIASLPSQAILRGWSESNVLAGPGITGGTLTGAPVAFLSTDTLPNLSTGNWGLTVCNTGTNDVTIEVSGTPVFTLKPGDTNAYVLSTEMRAGNNQVLRYDGFNGTEVEFTWVLRRTD